MSENEKRKGYIRAAYAPDGPTALTMINSLKDHGIDAYRRGGVKDIYRIGGDIFGEEIMVDPEDLSDALEILGEAGTAGNDSSSAQKPSSMKTLPSLLAAAALFVVLLFLRSRFLS